MVKLLRRNGRRLSMGFQLAKLLDVPKKSRTKDFYVYLGKMLDENRLHEIEGWSPAVAAAIYQKMLEAGWFDGAPPKGKGKGKR